MPQSTSPFRAQERAQNKMRVADSVMQIGQELGQIKQQYDIGEASATTAAKMGEFEKQYAGKQVYTPDEVKELGLEGLVSLQEGGEERQFIPAHEVYPIALQQAGEQAIREGKAKISSAGIRKTWEQEMTAKHQNVVTNALESARTNAYRYTVNSMSREATAMQESGLFLAAEEKIRAMPIPDDQKRPLLLENAKLQEMDMYNRAAVTENPEELQLVADDLAQKMDDGQLLMNDTEARQTYSMLIGKRNAAVSEQARRRKVAGDDMAMSLVNEMMTTGSVSNEVIEIMQNPQAAALMGKENVKWIQGEADRIARGDTFQTSEYNKNWFEIQMSEILAGNYGSYISQGSGKFDQSISTYGQALDDLEMWVKENANGVDPYTRQPTGMIAGADMRAWLQRIQNERQMPSTQNEAYKAAVTDLRQRLYGTDAGLLSGLQSTSTGSVFANAVGELREAVRQDPQFDIANWQKTRMPTYLEEAARGALIGLTGQYEPLTDYIQYQKGDTFGVDAQATRRALIDAVRNPPPGATREMVQDAVLLYEDWANGIGADYVN